jgi:ADP-ribose pyrophosphatase
MNRGLAEEKISSKKIFDGEILKLFFDEVKLPNGKIATREKVSHPGAVAIAPVTDSRKILLVKQYRYPVDRVTIEIPAGKIDGREAPEKCARREMAEEVGAVGGKLKLLSSFYTTPGYCDEVLHLFLATGFQRAENNLDEDEFLEILEIDMSTAVQWINSGKINDSKTIIGILMAWNFLNNG